MSIGYFYFFYLAKIYQLGDGKNWKKPSAPVGFHTDGLPRGILVI